MDFETKLFLLKHAGLEDDLAQMESEYEAEASHPGRSFLGGAGLGMGALGGAALAGRYAPDKYKLLASIAGGALGGGSLGMMGEYLGRHGRAQEAMNRDLSDIDSDIDTGLGMQGMSPEQLQQLAGRSDEISQYLAAQGM